MKEFSVSEWNEKPILRKTIFKLSRCKNRTAFFYSDYDRYMLTAELQDEFDLSYKMTAEQVADQSIRVTISKLY